MLTVAILCSGQGAQAKGMFDAFADAPEAQDVFAAATSELGGRDPRDLVASASDDLHENATAQVLCCTHALAVWAVVKPLVDARLVVAGYSVGELAAWGVAGALAPDIVLGLAGKRAAAMDAATDGPAGLVAIRGLPASTIDVICRDTGVEIAIRNGDERVIVGGRRAALDQAIEAAATKGAAGTTRIAVEVPSHTSLLREAAKNFDTILAEQAASRPEARLLSGIDGESVFDVRDGLAKLASQIAQMVDWAACMEACRAAGAVRALELGPGNALAGMMGTVIDERDCRSVADFRSLAGAARWLQRA